jgi:serine/threonine-protein kinase HipA
MGRIKKTQELNVYLNGIKVGRLKKDTSGLISFNYSKVWIDEGFPISLSLPIQEQGFKGEIVARYFDNLLPDNENLKKIIAQKFGAESTRSFDLLSVIGKDCVGALSFIVDDKIPPEIFEMNYSPLNEKKISSKIRGLGLANPLGMSLNDFRISIAGAQEKTALLKIGKNWYEPHGQTPTTHILKTSIGALGLGINFDDSIDNEWASLFIMQKFGLETCEASIERFEDQRVLVIERFDRKWMKDDGRKVVLRIPQEDLCQALSISPYKKYQNEGGPNLVNIAKLLSASQEEKDRFNFFKAIMIFDLLYATDGHGKNFSLSINSKGFKMTPFYDVMSGYFLHEREKIPLQKLKLAMSVGNSNHYRFSKVVKRHYAESAKKCFISSDDFEKIVDEIKNSFESFNFNKKELDPDLNQNTLEIILEGMKKRVGKIL